MNKETRGALLTLAGGICWGLSGSMGQYLFQHEGMDSRWLVPIRLGLAGIILFFFCLQRYGAKLLFQPWKSRRDAFELIVYGLFGVSLCQFLYFLTIQLSTAGVATILQDLSPIMILLCSCIHLKRKPHAYELIAIALALLGIFLLTTHGNLHSFAVPLSALITGILSAVCVTVYNITPKHLMSCFPVTVMQAWSFLMGGSVISLIFRPWQIHYVPNAIGIFGIAFVVVVGNILAFTCYITGVKYIGPEKSILYGFAEPITAAIISTAVLGSPFTLWDVLGFAAVFAMLTLISVGDRLPHSARKSVSGF